MIYDFSWCIWIKNGSWSCFDTDLEKLLFLFRNTEEKWETHFCPSWHLILDYSSEVEKKCDHFIEMSKCQLIFSRILYFPPSSISQAKNGMAFHAEPISIKGKWSRKKSSDNFLRQHSVRFVGFSAAKVSLQLWFTDWKRGVKKSL